MDEKIKSQFEKEYYERPLEPYNDIENPDQWFNVLNWQCEYTNWLESRLKNLDEQAEGEANCQNSVMCSDSGWIDCDDPDGDYVLPWHGRPVFVKFRTGQVCIGKIISDMDGWCWYLWTGVGSILMEDEYDMDDDYDIVAYSEIPRIIVT